MAAARAKGHRGGRPAKLTDKQLALVDRLMVDPSTTGQQVAEQFGVHRGTLYRALREFRRRHDTKA